MLIAAEIVGNCGVLKLGPLVIRNHLGHGSGQHDGQCSEKFAELVRQSNPVEDYVLAAADNLDGRAVSCGFNAEPSGSDFCGPAKNLGLTNGEKSCKVYLQIFKCNDREKAFSSPRPENCRLLQGSAESCASLALEHFR